MSRITRLADRLESALCSDGMDRLLIAFAMLILVAVCWGLGLEVTR